jgi:hypothetical protein
MSEGELVFRIVRSPHAAATDGSARIPIEMTGLRSFLRNFTASAVREHLRSQVESSRSSPELTPNEVELVRFVRQGSFDWDAFLAEHSDG